MNCREFEEQHGRELSAAAREHLASCERCRAFADAFASVESAVPSQSAVDAAVSLTSRSLRPVRPLPAPWVLLLLLACASAAVFGFGLYWLGSSGWEAMETARLRVIVFGGLALLFAGAGWMLVEHLYPGKAKLPVNAGWLVLSLTALAGGTFLLFPWEYDPDGFREFGESCMKKGLIIAGLASLPIFGFMRAGYSTHPGWSAAAGGLASGLISFSVLELYCPLLEQSHVFAWHLTVPVATVAVYVALFWIFRRFLSR